MDLSGGANAGSPESSIPPVFVTPRIVRMPEGGLVAIDLAPGISDPDDSFECVMAPTGIAPGASGISTLATNPNNLSIIAVSSACVLSWDTTGLNVGDRYAVQVRIIEDPLGAANPVVLDFIVEIAAADCGDGVIETGEDCDGASNDAACDGLCRAPGSSAECTCPVCGDDILDAGEGCDGAAGGVFGACPGVCEPPGSPIECQCPACGDDVTSVQTGEECDGTDDAACVAGECLTNCQCTTCGDNTAEPPVEQCDGTDDLACPGECQPDCVCASCGNDVLEGSEECDGTADAACPGTCLSSCICAICGDNLTAPPIEECDGTDDTACPGFCLPFGDPNQCQCPVCGDGDINQVSEQCDGADDAACPGFCLPSGDANECQCPICGDDDVNQLGETCDGADDSACPGSCQPDCTCPVCGDNATEGSEQCDGTDDTACPGFCLPPGNVNECQCPVCGDGDINQLSEECDGAEDGACTGACLPDCTCSVCGDDVAEPPVEQCDGSDDTACPGECLPPGHAFQCRCEFCGDGDLNQPGEECDPPTDEVCNNLVDDNDNGLVDCLDPSCSRRCEHDSNVLCSTMRDCRQLQIGSECLDAPATCGASCEIVLGCQLTLSDPAHITLGGEDDLDRLWLHTQFRPASAVDVAADGFSMLISNAQDEVYRVELPGSALIASGRRSFVYRDKSAREGDGKYSGLYSIKIMKRDDSYTFRLRVYSDLSTATVARMTTQIVLGNDSTSLTADWTPTKKGWKIGSDVLL